MIHPLLNLTITGAIWYQGMYVFSNCEYFLLYYKAECILKLAAFFREITSSPFSSSLWVFTQPNSDHDSIGTMEWVPFPFRIDLSPMSLISTVTFSGVGIEVGSKSI